MTEAEYWGLFETVRGDIEGAIACHVGYLKIHNTAAENRAILDKYNRTPEFWRLNSYALQTTFFIALGRLFDATKGTVTLTRLLDETVEHRGLFTKEQLRRYKISQVNGEPDWLEKYIAEAWEPSRADLQQLRDFIDPHIKRYNDVYAPLRHMHFAHRGKESSVTIGELFGRTKIGDATEILRDCCTVMDQIKEIQLNGRKPDLTDYSRYEEFVKHHGGQVEKLIFSLP